MSATLSLDEKLDANEITISNQEVNEFYARTKSSG